MLRSVSEDGSKLLISLYSLNEQELSLRLRKSAKRSFLFISWHCGHWFRVWRPSFALSDDRYLTSASFFTTLPAWRIFLNRNLPILRWVARPFALNTEISTLNKYQLSSKRHHRSLIRPGFSGTRCIQTPTSAPWRWIDRFHSEFLGTGWSRFLI